MRRGELIKELQLVISGDPWYGSSVVRILEAVDPQTVMIRNDRSHTIAEILLHMISWTEETQARLTGKPASEPLRGDWPDPAQYTWIELIGLFLLANEHLQNTIVKMEERLLEEPIHDKRVPALGTGVSYEALIKGLIQHHIYHSGQISLLTITV